MYTPGKTGIGKERPQSLVTGGARVETHAVQALAREGSVRGLRASWHDQVANRIDLLGQAASSWRVRSPGAARPWMTPSRRAVRSVRA